MTVNQSPGEPGRYPGSSYPGNRGQNSPYSAPPPPYAPPPYTPLKPFSTKAIVAICCGGVSVFMWPLAPIVGVVGVVTGWLGMKESKEPHGSHRGWGVALAGLLMSAGMFFISIALAGLMVWVFSFAEKQQEKMAQKRAERELQWEYEDAAEKDIRLMVRRLQVYHLEHRSLEPGGPLMRLYPGDGLLPEGFQTVDEPLQVKHLVEPGELEHSIAEYTLRVHADGQGYTLKNDKAGLTLQVDNARTPHIVFDRRLSGGK